MNNNAEIDAMKEIGSRIKAEVFTGDFKGKLLGLIEVVEDNVDSLSREERLKITDDLVETYVSHTGEVPDNQALSSLSDIILRDELSDMDRDKITNNEYPFLSERQYERKVKGESPIEHARNFGTDGKNYSMPIRIFINNEE